MTRRVACPPAPGLLEDYAAQFDDAAAACRPAPRAPRVPAWAAAAARAQQDADRAGGHRAGARRAGPARAAPAVVPVRGGLGRRGAHRPPPGTALPRPGDAAARRRRARHRRDGRPQGRHEDRPRRAPVPRRGRAHRQRHRQRDQPVGRRGRSTTRCTSRPTPRRSGWPRARTTPPSAPSPSSRSSSSTPPSRRASPSGRWWPTASYGEHPAVQTALWEGAIP